jgi:hypothetical protein
MVWTQINVKFYMYNDNAYKFFANKNSYIIIVCTGFLEDKILSMNAFSIKSSNTLTLIIEFLKSVNMA